MGWSDFLGNSPVMSDAPDDHNWDGQPSAPNGGGSVTLQQLFNVAMGRPATSLSPMTPPDSGNTPVGGPPQASSSPSIVGVLNQFLRPYGLQTQEYQNAFLPNNSHPKLSNMFERALYGAAMTQSGDTIGENIGNVARSVIGVPGAMRQAKEARMMEPLQQAGAIQNIASMQATASYHSAQAQAQVAQADKERAQAEYYRSAGKRRYWGQPFPAKGKDGKFYLAQQDDTNGTSRWLTDPDGNLMEASPKSVMPRAQTAGSQAERMAQEEDVARDQRGEPPMTAQEHIAFVKKWNADNAANNTAARMGAEQPYKYSDSEKLAVDNAKEIRNKGLINANDATARNAFRKNYLYNGGELANVEAAWQSHVNENNAKVQSDYADAIENVRPKQPMPGKKQGKGSPQVDIRPDGTISVSRK